MTITNITELIKTESLTGLLCLCGATQDEIGKTASDYAYFQAVCRAVPLLTGHRFVPFLHGLFDLMKLEYNKTAPNAELIWQQSAEYLERNRISREDISNIKSQKNALSSFSWKKENAQAVLDTDPWISTNAADWTEWEPELNECWKQAIARNEISLVHLSAAFPSQKPSIYHVNLALKSNRNSRVLSAQLLRFLCVKCCKQNKTLLIEAEQSGSENLCRLLQELDRAVGLPAMVLSVQTMQDLKNVLSLVQQLHRPNIRIGVMKNAEISKVDLSSIAAIYPIGRLFLYERNGQELCSFSITTNQ